MQGGRSVEEVFRRSRSGPSHRIVRRGACGRAIKTVLSVREVEDDLESIAFTFAACEQATSRDLSSQAMPKVVVHSAVARTFGIADVPTEYIRTFSRVDCTVDGLLQCKGVDQISSSVMTQCSVNIHRGLHASRLDDEFCQAFHPIAVGLICVKFGRRAMRDVLVDVDSFCWPRRRLHQE